MLDLYVPITFVWADFHEEEEMMVVWHIYMWEITGRANIWQF